MLKTKRRSYAVQCNYFQLDEKNDIGEAYF